VAGPDEWTVIFSKNSTSWGSFFYTAAEDALRVKVKPRKAEYTHWLTYEFTTRQPSKAVAALRWEYLEVPWTITVDNVNDLYVENLRHELRNSPGFTWQSWQRAARFCLDNKINLKEALVWAQNAVSMPDIGRESFASLGTLADLQTANGLAAEADATMQKAIAHPTAGPLDLHQYGRQLLAKATRKRRSRSSSSTPRSTRTPGRQRRSGARLYRGGPHEGRTEVRQARARAGTRRRKQEEPAEDGRRSDGRQAGQVGRGFSRLGASRAAHGWGVTPAVAVRDGL